MPSSKLSPYSRNTYIFHLRDLLIFQEFSEKLKPCSRSQMIRNLKIVNQLSLSNYVYIRANCTFPVLW